MSLGGFEPIFPSHSIERCGLALMFNAPLPPKLLQKVVEQTAPQFRNFGLSSQPFHGFEIDAASAQVKIAADGAARFVSADQSFAVVVLPDSIQMQTGKYIRWDPFLDAIEDLILPLAKGFGEASSLSAIQLDYLDVFRWVLGDWSNFNWQELVRQDSPYVAAAARQASRQWHSHSGWFYDIEESKRRLSIVNIDVVERSFGASTSAPAVNILTLEKYEAYGPGASVGFDVADIPETANNLHERLKALFKQAINDEMLHRVGLD